MIQLVVLFLVGYCSAKVQQNDTCTMEQRGNLEAGKFNVLLRCNGSNYAPIGCQGGTGKCMNFMEDTLALNYSAQFAASLKTTFAQQAAYCEEAHYCVCAMVNANISAHPNKQILDLQRVALTKLAEIGTCNNEQRSDFFADHAFNYIYTAVEQEKCEAKLSPMSSVDRTSVCEATPSICIDLAKLKHITECNRFFVAQGCDDESCMCNKLKDMYRYQDNMQDKTGILILNNMTHATTCPAVEIRSDDDKHAYQIATIMSNNGIEDVNCQARKESNYKGDVTTIRYFTYTETNRINNNVVALTKVRCVSHQILQSRVLCNIRLRWHYHENCSVSYNNPREQCMFEVVQALYDKARSSFEAFFFEKYMGFGECMRDEAVNLSSVIRASTTEMYRRGSVDCLTNLHKLKVFKTCLIDLNNQILKLSDVYAHLSCDTYLQHRLNCVSPRCSCDDIAKEFAILSRIDYFKSYMYAILRVEVVPVIPSDQLMEVHMKDGFDLFSEIAESKPCFEQKKLESVEHDFICAIEIDQPANMHGIRNRTKSGKCLKIGNLGRSNHCHPSLKNLLPEAVKLFTLGKLIYACAELQRFYDTVQNVITFMFLLEDALDIKECMDVRVQTTRVQATRVQTPQDETFSQVYRLVADSYRYIKLKMDY